MESFSLQFNFFPFKIATPASEIDVGGRADLEASAAPMDTDATITTGNISHGGSPDEQQKQGSDTDGGQEPGQIAADLDAVGELLLELGKLQTLKNEGLELNH